jgi:ribosomal protein S27AE
MEKIISLTCPSCGGKLQITNDIERFACGNCGNELLVRRFGNAISLAPVVAEIKKVKEGVDRTASELAIPRLKREIEELGQQ